MSDRELALEALSVLCNTRVTSIQEQSSRPGFLSGMGFGSSASLTIPGLMPMLAGRTTDLAASYIIDENEFLDPQYHYDFTDLQDTETYYRGDEVYERPCGWKRFALKVLDKYPDGNAWLGERGNRSGTDSKLGEWPVSYHGTSKTSTKGIIVAQYEPGPGEKYGRGIYSTPYISEAQQYTKTFNFKDKTYQVILQNRINPKYREKHNKGKYWLVPIPTGLSDDEEQEIVEKAIRPYAFLLKHLTA